MSDKFALIVGAGPAGLTAAHELLRRTDIKPVVLEQADYLGGISRTAEFRGNRIDIGGHRFFSKSDRVMSWWLERMPLQRTSFGGRVDEYHGKDGSPGVDGPDPDKIDRVMLIRERRSRIYWRRRLFNYPLTLSGDTIRKMGLWRISKAGLSYLRSAAFPIKPEKTLEEFLVNRFGRELYRTFFKSYTEKVWGVSCDSIPADWGVQRIKGLSILKAIRHALGKALRGEGDLSQKKTETSLIEQFLYPKLGPGQMWETVAEEIRKMGGEVLMSHRVTGFRVEGSQVVEVEATDLNTNRVLRYATDHVFSSMPIRELVLGMRTHVPATCQAIAKDLPYRDFFTVGLLVDKLKLVDDRDGGPVRDNWIYIQEPDVLIGRLQIFNNWSPYMVADRSKVWLGLEYFCQESDEIWSARDEDLVELGARELDRIGIIDRVDATDGCVIRMKKAYPAYFGSYARFDEVKQWLMGFENLYCIGRNGQHRYNNQDHSMLSAMVAVDNIVEGVKDQSSVWNVNTEAEYHENKDNN